VAFKINKIKLYKYASLTLLYTKTHKFGHMEIKTSLDANTMSLKPIKQIKNSNQLTITAYGIKATTGNTDFGLFGAISTLLNTSVENPNIKVPSDTVHGGASAHTAAIPAYVNLDPDERMLEYLCNALNDVAEQLRERHHQEKKYQVLIILPATIFERSTFIDQKQMQTVLKETFSGFTNCLFKFVHADTNVTKHLQTACATLQEEKIDSIIFAGVDSLVDPLTCRELITTNRLRSSENTDGVVPGEAGACVVIEKGGSSHPHSRGLITGLTHTNEPNSGKADKKALTGLSTVIQGATQMAGLHPDDIDVVVFNGLYVPRTALEWYQTSQTVWPNTLSEQQRVAYQMGELDDPPSLKPRKIPEQLDPNFSLGEIGAATLPLSIILGCARFDFTYPSVENCLICDASEFLFRGAILLSNPHNNSALMNKTTRQ